MNNYNHNNQLRFFCLALLVVLLSSMAVVPVVQAKSSSGAVVYQPGKAQTRVVPLTKDNFDHAIKNDPQNPFWLLKFYAPWCGHCKKLAPVLEIAAAQTIGRMSIGKIDCTVEKSVCNQFSIRGYPTLKYSWNGQIEDYPGSRDEKDIVNFATRMTRPAVNFLQAASSEKLQEWLLTATDAGVGFVGFHPHTKEPPAGTTITTYNQNDIVQDMLSTNSFLQTYRDVAQDHKSHANFALLPPNADLSGILINEGNVETAQKFGFIARVEPHVEPRLFWDTLTGMEAETQDEADQVGDDMATKLAKDTMNSFVKDHNVPLVSALGPHNFHKIGRNGRPLVIGVVDEQGNADQVELVRQAFAEYAASPLNDNHKDQYYWGTMDGTRWISFMKNFEIDSSNKNSLPIIFVLNVPEKLYWKDTSYFEKGDNLQTALKNFLNAIDSGEIEVKTSGKPGIMTYLAQFLPWNFSTPLLVVFVIGSIAMVFVLPSPAALKERIETQMGETSGDGAGSENRDQDLLGTTAGRSREEIKKEE